MSEKGYSKKQKDMQEEGYDDEPEYIQGRYD
jgi:hypothetical protein